jgi:hypothetical protein
MRKSAEKKEELLAFRKWISALTTQELVHAMQCEFIKDDNDDNNDGETTSHEFTLLQQLVDNQSPPPTPIHPKGMGYRPFATKIGANDGRDEEARVYKDRFTRPRLFQFMEQRPTTTISTNRRKQKRRYYDVICRRKVTPCGDVLGLGCTQEQRTADESILKGTVLYRRDNSRCCFSETMGLSKTPGQVLRMLQVVSRGHFLQAALPTTAKNCQIWSPWLAPTERWFSLPMYLASRYEVALWSTFRRGSMLPSLSTPIRDAVDRLSIPVMRVAQQKAMTRTLATIVLPQDRANVPMLRDGMLYHIMLNQNSELMPVSLGDFTPLLQLGTVSDKFHTHLRIIMEEELILQMQEALMSLDDDEPLVVAPKRRKGKKKKKRRAAAKQQQVEAAKLLPPDADDDVDDAMLDDSSDHHVRFVDSAPPSMERTRKMLIAMSVLENVIEDVFVRVGLPPSAEPVEENKKEDKSTVITKEIVTDVVAINSATRMDELSPNPFLSSEPSLPVSPSFVTNQSAHDGVLSFLNPQNDSALGTLHQNEIDLRVFNQSAPGDVPWTFEDDQLGSLMDYPNREKSVFADFFLKDKRVDASKNKNMVASSTAASIASSTDKEPGTVDDEPDGISDVSNDCADEESVGVLPTDERLVELMSTSFSEVDLEKGHVSSPDLCIEREPFGNRDETKSNSCNGGDQDVGLRSPSPPAPRTPSPRLSPILVSLADLKDMRERAPSIGEHREMAEARKKSQSSFVAGSLPSSPVVTASNTLTPSWSRDDLRIKTFMDNQLTTKAGDSLGTRRVDALVSYRNAVMRPGPKSVNTAKGEIFSTALGEERLVPVRCISVPELDPSAPKRRELDNCAQSETAIDAHAEEDRWHAPRKDHTGYIHVRNITTTRDESAKVYAQSPREPEELATLREERNTFRDMCLTLGAEVAKLKNILAAQQGNHMQHRGHEYLAAHSTYNPAFLQPNFHGITRATTIGATSDTGIHRGDHDSAIMSEDGTDHAGHDHTGKPRSIQVRHLSPSATAVGSDASLDQNFGARPNISAFIPTISNDAFGTDFVSGVHSRLTKDVIKFLNANTTQLQQADLRRKTAVHRLSRLVTALWPRAQVKLYGSYVTGLSLPSSDLDFVICLPAVHKNAPAITPGALEGRNAVNESSQKLLARRLKGESWIDTRSIKIIERTVVPVIKVSTKDTRARAMQLDISFDGPVHHGLEAIHMVNDILQQIPMVRPLVLVLKQFLLDRGLSTAYTGGLSSYCLFLMVTRYLQEQPSSWGDCGSLLMGFLDFYGNSFDPRATGISVGRRLYFARRAPSTPHVVYQAPAMPPITPPAPPPSVGRPDFRRRHSLSEKGDVDPNWNRPPRRLTPTAPRFQPPNFNDNPKVASGKSYTFDPLWVEDPLSAGNNVGRNAFRIFQVQRAFSDAHRALVASLEWENVCNVHNEVADYPLLKCLLQSEDVFYDLDDHHH